MLIGGLAQAIFLRGTFDRLLEETPDSGQVRQSHFLAQFIDFCGFDKGLLANYVIKLNITENYANCAVFWFI